jgi:hypothetical protein
MSGWLRMWSVLLLALLVTGCGDYDEVKRETGYKGKARVNPWLAAERFTEKLGYDVISSPTWKSPEWSDSVCFMPASLLNNASFTDRFEKWIADGGHLVLLVEYADSDHNDWRSYPFFNETELDTSLVAMLERAGLVVETKGSGGKGETYTELTFRGMPFKVTAESKATVKEEDGKAGVFASVERGDGRISVLTDARILRSRWIGDREHAALLRALIEASPMEGSVMFVRGSGMSFWGLLGRYLWPVLIGLALLIALWLWNSFSRFGPVESAVETSPLRGYDHHLEALGDFQWRLDKGASLLAPLREQIIEKGQQLGVKTGRRDEDFFQLLAERARIPRERVVRALTEAAPTDSAIMTRTVADLQRLLAECH